jgi:uncharacterized membrane protein
VNDWLQALLLAPLVLAIPGYAIAAAIFPPGSIERADRIVYSFVFSISVAALGGVVLQVVLRLDRTAWLILLAIVTVAAGLVARWRGGALPIQGFPDRPPVRPPSGALWAVALLSALAIAGGAVSIAVEGVRKQQRGQRFASLWAVPERIGAGAPRVEVGVWNHGGPAAYRLEVRSEERTFANLRLRLEHNQRWQAMLGPEVPARGRAVLVTLYHRSAPYRSVELNIKGVP